MTVKVGLTLTDDDELTGLLRASGTTATQVDLAKPDAPGLDTLDILLVDVREQDHLPLALASFRQKHPDVGVVIVMSALDPALMLEALRAGVNERGGPHRLDS